jgi:hypothetical protein
MEPTGPICVQNQSIVCALCVQINSNLDNITKLACNHMFCSPCLSIWEEKYSICPLCAQPAIWSIREDNYWINQIIPFRKECTGICEGREFTAAPFARSDDKNKKLIYGPGFMRA